MRPLTKLEYSSRLVSGGQTTANQPVYFENKPGFEIIGWTATLTHYNSGGHEKFVGESEINNYYTKIPQYQIIPIYRSIDPMGD